LLGAARIEVAEAETRRREQQAEDERRDRELDAEYDAQYGPGEAAKIDATLGHAPVGEPDRPVRMRLRPANDGPTEGDLLEMRMCLIDMLQLVHEMLSGAKIEHQDTYSLPHHRETIDTEIARLMMTVESFSNTVRRHALVFNSLMIERWQYLETRFLHTAVWVWP
jgi:hypothetical protein